MRIGIDAKWILSGPVSGKIVIKNIIENFPKKKNLFLFVKKKSIQEYLKNMEKILILSLFLCF